MGVFELVDEVPVPQRGAVAGFERVWDTEAIRNALVKAVEAARKKGRKSIKIYTDKFIEAFYTGDEKSKKKKINDILKSSENPDNKELYKTAYNTVATIKKKLENIAVKEGITINKEESGIRNKDLRILYLTFSF